METFIESVFFQFIIENVKPWVINEFPALLLIIILFFIVFKIVSFSLKRIKRKMLSRAECNEKVDTDESSKRINTLYDIFHGFIKMVLWVVLIIMILQRVGLNTAPLLASAGIIGLAIGFGAQELVRDYIAGFFVILENQIRVGDVVSINQTSGIVEKIELRTTTLRDFSGTVHVFQNGKINSISNMTKDWSAIVFDIGVAYKEDTQAVIDIMKQVGDELMEDSNFKNDIKEPIEVFGLNEFADSALVIKARFKTKPIHQWRVGREYRKRLKEAFDKNNIEIPFPHTTVYWGEKTNPLKIDVDKR